MKRIRGLVKEDNLVFWPSAITPIDRAQLVQVFNRPTLKEALNNA